MNVPQAEHDNPMLYPWAAPERSGLMIDDQIFPFVRTENALGESHLEDGRCMGEYLASRNLPSIEDRHVVVAVGANASPFVMCRKLTAGTAISTPVIPFVRSTVKHLAVGHAGYSSVRGYIPATPYHNQGATTSLWVSYLDDDQMEVLDATEPNYHRVKVSSEHYPFTLENGNSPNSFWIYESYRGVLIDRHGKPIPLTSQEKLHQTLREIDQLRHRFGVNVAKNMLELNASKNRPSIVEVFKKSGTVIDTNIISHEKCRTEISGPSDEELADLEKELKNTKSDEIDCDIILNNIT